MCVCTGAEIFARIKGGPAIYRIVGRRGISRDSDLLAGGSFFKILNFLHLVFLAKMLSRRVI